MHITSTQVEELIESRLQDTGLSKFVNRDYSQFLDVAEELFVEIVLNDGTALEDVEKIVRHTAQELKTQGVRLDSVVRAIWEVGKVDYIGPARGSSGGLRAAYEFRVTLKSGERSHQVSVDVSWGAMEFLEHKLGLKKFVAGHDDALRQGHLDEVIVGNLVRSFVQYELSRGGTSYWNPLLDGRLDLNDTAMAFFLGQSTAFNELRQAISDAFEPAVVESFLASLAVSRVRIRDFGAVLPEFSNMLGGAYRRGETFSTSASELFQKMDRTEQELLKKYFYGKVEVLKSESPELVRHFPEVFS